MKFKIDRWSVMAGASFTAATALGLCTFLGAMVGSIAFGLVRGLIEGRKEIR